MTLLIVTSCPRPSAVSLFQLRIHVLTCALLSVYVCVCMLTCVCAIAKYVSCTPVDRSKVHIWRRSYDLTVTSLDKRTIGVLSALPFVDASTVQRFAKIVAHGNPDLTRTFQIKKIKTLTCKHLHRSWSQVRRRNSEG